MCIVNSWHGNSMGISFCMKFVAIIFVKNEGMIVILKNVEPKQREVHASCITIRKLISTNLIWCQKSNGS
jgi:hypothetical protein